MDGADEVLEHLLGDGEVGNHAVFHGSDGFDVEGNPAQHRLGFVPNSDQFFIVGNATGVLDGDHRRFV